MTAVLQVFNAGYTAFAQRLPRPLAAAQVFNPSALVGLDAAGKATPFLASTVAGIQYALGAIDPSYIGSPFTSGASDSAPVLTGTFSLVNGTSGNAFAQAQAGADAYTADGLTANLTSATNPLPVSGTTTGKFLGVFLGFDPNVAGNVLISVIPELNAPGAVGTGDMLLGAVQTNTGAKTFLNNTFLLRNAGNTFSTTLEAAATAARVITLPDATATLARAAVATGADGTEATGSTTPSFTGSSVTPTPGAPVTGLSGTSTGQVVSLIVNSVTLNQYAGGYLSDGVSTFLILSNTATSTGVATFTVFGPAPATTITAVGAIVPVGVIAAGTAGAHTHAGPSHTHLQS